MSVSYFFISMMVLEYLTQSTMNFSFAYFETGSQCVAQTGLSYPNARVLSPQPYPCRGSWTRTLPRFFPRAAPWLETVRMSNGKDFLLSQRKSQCEEGPGWAGATQRRVLGKSLKERSSPLCCCAEQTQRCHNQDKGESMALEYFRPDFLTVFTLTWRLSWRKTET